MPLTRANVTVAARVMLPTYVALSLLFGLGYIIDPQHRLALAPSTAGQRAVLPLACWGAVLLALGAVMVAAMATRHRSWFVIALGICTATWFLWGCSIVPALWLTPNTSYLAPLLPWFVAIASYASMRSLQEREV